MRLRSISARLAVIYTVAYAVAVAVLGIAILLATRATLREQFEAHIRTESTALVREYHTEGLGDVVEAVRERDRTPGALDYGLSTPDSRPVAGWLADVQAPEGWSTRALVQPSGAPETVRIWTAHFPDGHRLLVGDDLRRIDSLNGVVLRGFAFALVGITTLGGIGGYLLSRDVRRRFAAIAEVADAISEGDLSRRAPVRPTADELDQLAVTFNRMLDRIGALMDSLRQVSNDVAHDLRTPLTRLRQRLERAVTSRDPEIQSQAIDGAMVELDAVLDTFAALLRIAQIEGGARRAGFRTVDLDHLAHNVVESFAPSAEEGGRFLTFAGPREVRIVGDAELLTQMVVNLVENGLRHTPVGARVLVRVAEMGRRAELVVADDGPGLPRAEHHRIFDRFYRLERSRSTPGSGLGLSLVAAVAKLHDAEVSLVDLRPGLEIRISFPIRPGG